MGQPPIQEAPRPRACVAPTGGWGPPPSIRPTRKQFEAMETFPVQSQPEQVPPGASPSSLSSLSFSSDAGWVAPSPVASPGAILTRPHLQVPGSLALLEVYPGHCWGLPESSAWFCSQPPAQTLLWTLCSGGTRASISHSPFTRLWSLPVLRAPDFLCCVWPGDSQGAFYFNHFASFITVYLAH